MKVNKIIPLQQKIEINDITLLSKEEYMKYKDNISNIDGIWWLQSPGDSRHCAARVCFNGSHYFSIVSNDDVYVRPVLRVDNLKIGIKFTLAEHTWTVISPDLALCDEPIMKSYFRKDWQEEDANVYEVSDIKKNLEKWAEEHNIFTKEIGLCGMADRKD
jgi:hypothetical protein